MSALIGSSGFVGGHLQKSFEFTHTFNRANISKIRGLETDLLICAGLPAEKWKANKDPESDWWNMASLAQNLSFVAAQKAILISTIDVYQPAIDVTEDDAPNYIGEDAYGRNRAWFETFFTKKFQNTLIIRLPGLFASDLRKNLIFDLINGRSDQLDQVNKDSIYQFFNVSKIWDVLNICINNQLTLLNLATEPVTAQEIAELFNVQLNATGSKVRYNMRSIHAETFKGRVPYIQSKEQILREISSLKS